VKIHSVYLVSPSPDTLGDFYQRFLGQAPQFSVPQTWTQFRGAEGGAALAIACPAEAAPGAVGATVVFEVSDIQEALTKAESLGGTLINQRDMGSHGKTASFRDPGGNIVQLLQKVAAKPQ
jgi:predicted enzyme related to lactoylglutathione lyase